MSGVDVEVLLNKVYEHPDSRMRLGHWTPDDVRRYVLPRLLQSQRELEEEEATILAVLDECGSGDVPIIDQLNEEGPPIQ